MKSIQIDIIELNRAIRWKLKTDLSGYQLVGDPAIGVSIANGIATVNLYDKPFDEVDPNVDKPMRILTFAECTGIHSFNAELDTEDARYTGWVIVE